MLTKSVNIIKISAESEMKKPDDGLHNTQQTATTERNASFLKDK